MRIYDPTCLNTPTDVELHPASAFGKARDIMTNGYYPKVVIEGGPIGQLPLAMRTIDNSMTVQDVILKALKAVAAQRSAYKSQGRVAMVMNSISAADIDKMATRMETGQTRLLMAEMEAAVVKATSQVVSAQAFSLR